MALSRSSLQTLIEGNILGFSSANSSQLFVFLYVLSDETVKWATNISYVQTNTDIVTYIHSHEWTVGNGTALSTDLITAISGAGLSTTNTGLDSTTWLAKFINAIGPPVGAWMLSSPVTSIANGSAGHVHAIYVPSVAPLKSSLISAVNAAGLSTTNTGLDSTTWLLDFINAYADSVYTHLYEAVSTTGSYWAAPHTFA